MLGRLNLTDQLMLTILFFYRHQFITCRCSTCNIMFQCDVVQDESAFLPMPLKILYFMTPGGSFLTMILPALHLAYGYYAKILATARQKLNKVLLQ